MGGVEINHSEKEKYLDDVIHENGCRESINATIIMRMCNLISKCDEIHRRISWGGSRPP